MSTKDLSEITQPGQPAFGLPASVARPTAIFPGGVPLKSGGEVVGAVGASGGMPDQDHAVASAGAVAFAV